MSINTFNKIIICLFSGLMLYQLTACSTFYPDTAIPAYVRVDSTVLTVKDPSASGQGAPTTNITDAWAYVNNNPVGVYDVPALFPVLDQGNTLIQLSAGIEDNGISNTRTIYPFYTYDTVTVNLQPKNTIDIIPHLTYRSGTLFSFIDDFEHGTYFDKYPPTDTNINRLTNSSEVKYGSYCGYISLDAAHPVYQGITKNDSYTFPSTSAVYLEMDYMCNVAFNVGLTGIYGSAVGDTSTNYFEQINPKSYWNKIYINLTNEIQQYPSNSYQIGLFAQLPDSINIGQIYIDNIKVLHF